MNRGKIFLLIGLFLGYFISNSQVHGDSANNKIESTVTSDSIIKIFKEHNSVLEEFKEIKDEILADKVFEKSKSRIITWITVGGLFLVLVGLIGYWKIGDIVKGAVSKKIEDVSQKELKKEIEKQSDVYVEKLVSEKVASLNLSSIADKIKGDGQIALEGQLDSTKTQFDEFVSSKKEEIEGLAIQLKQSIDALNNPLSVTQKTRKSRRTVIEKQIESKVDYSSQMLGVRDCGSEGSIVGFAIAYCLEFQLLKNLNKSIRISPRQIYYFARANSNFNIKEDSGAFIKSGVKSVREHGAIAETDWPYKEGEFNKKPPTSEKNVAHYKVKKAVSIKALNEIKDSIKTIGPIVIGVSVFESLDSATNRKGVLSMPKEKEEIEGGIAICIVGYNDQTKLFKFINCWGEEWGDNGYGYVPYEYVQKYSDDGWALDGIMAEG